MATRESNILDNEQLSALEEIKTEIKNKFEIENIILYGSVVRGEMDEESDIDLLIITKNKLQREVRHEITDVVFEVNLKFGTNYSTLVVDKKSWEKGPYTILPIYEEIEKEGVVCE